MRNFGYDMPEIILFLLVSREKEKKINIEVKDSFTVLL